MKKLNIYPKHIYALFINKSISSVEKEVLIRKALIDYPDDEAGILYLLMLTLDILEKTEECIDVCVRIIPLLDDKVEIGNLYFYQGKKYLVLKNKDKAFEQFSKAIEINQVMEAGQELARIYKERLDWDNVIKAYDSIECKEKKDKLDKFFQKGYAYFFKKEFENAINCYKKYLEIEPNNSGVIANLGNMYGELERYDECIELLVKSLKIDPNDAETYYNLGNTYCEMDDYHMSMYYYLEALKLRPDYPSVYINMGSMALNEGDTEKGLEYLLKASELPIEDNFILSVLYEDLNKAYTTLENFERAEYYKIKLANLEGVDVENREIEKDDEKK